MCCNSADPARLPSFHTCVGANEERLTPKWYKEHGNYFSYYALLIPYDIFEFDHTSVLRIFLLYVQMIVTLSRYEQIN